MNTNNHTFGWHCTLIFAVLCLRAAPVLGQDQPSPPMPLDQNPLLPRLVELNWLTVTENDRAGSRSRRPYLFHMPTGYLSEPLSPESESEPSPTEPGMPAGDPEGLDLPVQVAMVPDSPFYDFRLHGDQGGLGFYKIHTQLQVLDTDRTGCALGLQAVTPAGLEFDGLNDGPTVLNPNLALSHELMEGLTIHGFVSKKLRFNPGWDDRLDHSLEYGMAIHSPVPALGSPSLPRMHLFVEALARYRIDGETAARPSTVWELLPGVHWEMGTRWWLSGGVLVPLNTPRFESGLWQVTCSWQF